MILPIAWRDRLGELRLLEEVEMETASQTTVKGQVCGPVEIRVEGFRPIFTEVIFIEMQPTDGIYDPLVGYIVLEQCQAAVDMVGHRLVPVKYLDLK